MARIVLSSRGGQILEAGGFRYTRRSSNRQQTKSYWRCIERDGCTGTVTTNYNVNNGIYITIGKRHTHEPDNVEMEVQSVVRSMKRRAAEHPNAPPSSIFRDEISAVRSEEVLARLPQKNDVIRTLNRVQNRHRPVNPQALEDLVINPPYDRSLNGQLFMQFDETVGEDRIIMFYTNTMLQHLCSSRSIFCDGTFKTVPRMFHQLYTIHGIVRDYVFPLVYVLTTRKTQETYSQILNHLKTHAASLGFELSPQMILADFELAFMNAAQDIFPTSTMHGCLFHFTQAVWKMAVNKGLKVQYNQEGSNVRRSIQQLMALPFVPLADVEETFDIIANACPEDVMELAAYVEVTYVRGRAARGRRRATSPRYAPAIWNCYSAVLNRQQRSTNACEGWHSRFQRLIVSHHSSIWKFLENVKKDQRENEALIVQLNAGHTRIRYPIKGVYKRNQSQMEVIVGNYNHYKEEGNILRYLEALSYRIKLYAEEEEAEEE